MNSRKLFLCFLSIFTGIFIPCMPAADLDAVLPQVYTLGICSLRGVNIETEEVFFLNSIPAQILNSLQGIEDHYLSNDDMAAIEQKCLKDVIADLSEDIGDLYGDLDELFFQDDSLKSRQSTIASIEAKKEEMASYLAGEYDAVYIPNPLPVLFSDENIKGELLSPPGNYPLRFCETGGIDLLIYGSLEKVDEFFYLLIDVYDRYRDTVVLHRETACAGADLAEKGEEAADAILGLALGRDWASLKIQTEPPSASIYLDGKFLGAGIIYIPYFFPGKYTIEIRAPGFGVRARQVILEPGERREELLTLDEGGRSPFLVVTDPPGADIYMASEWIGKSPVEAIYPGNPVQLLVLMEGYQRCFRIISEPPSSTLKLELQMDPLVEYDIREDSRNRFYRDFSIFILSIPVSLLGYSVAEYYSIALNEAVNDASVSNDELYRLWLKASVCYNLYTTGLFANAFLLANMIVTAVEYVGRAGTPAGAQ